MTFNLDAVAREKKGEPFEFTFGGERYTLPASVDVIAATSLEAGKLHDGLHKLLGGEQWDRLLASSCVMDEEMFQALLEAYQKHLGVTLGESVASTDS